MEKTYNCPRCGKAYLSVNQDVTAPELQTFLQRFAEELRLDNHVCEDRGHVKTEGLEDIFKKGGEKKK